jgi:succinate dehydrogenase / fumarate reductase cytochrome b subunit
VANRPAGTLYEAKLACGRGFCTASPAWQFSSLLVHVLDTSLVRIDPAGYDAVIATYKTWYIGIGELGLVARDSFSRAKWCADHPD